MKKELLFISLFISTHLNAASAPWIGADLQGKLCNGSDFGDNRHDYITDRSLLKVVEKFHFTNNVENHIEGKSGSIPADMNYTLMMYPNHHRALLSAIRYQLKFNKSLLKKKLSLSSPVECYLQRAINFNPTDAKSHTLFAYYLKEVGQLSKAAKVYEKALVISPNNAKTEYLYALLLIELKQYDKAMEYAKKAYTHGKPPSELKNKLIKLGVWKESVDK